MTPLIQFAEARPRPIPPRIRLSGRSRQAIQETVADENKLLAAAALELQRFIRAARSDLLLAAQQTFAGSGGFTDGGAVISAAKVNEHSDRLAQVLAAARILGRLRIREEARLAEEEPVEMHFGEVFPRDVVPAEAVRYIRSLPVVEQAQWQAFVAEQRRAAFTVSGIEQRQVLRSLRDLIAESLDAGLTPAQFNQRAADLLRNFERVGPRHLRTVYNTTVGNALTLGREEQLDDPAVSSILTHRLFDAMNDMFTRPNHRALDGAIAPWEWWKTTGSALRPKLGFNCRCELIGLTRAAARRMIDAGQGFDIEAEGIPLGAGPDAGWERIAA